MAVANQNNQDPINTAVQGRVKWFNVKAGYGFIKRNDNNDDIFVHRASILRPNPEHPIPSLDDSEQVVFDIIQSTKGFEAVNVTGPGRANVMPLNPEECILIAVAQIFIKR
ncbi:Y-box-binding protein 2 [Cichlidogyrus casuarinus]|uniref:Y-box-binding protein 2 n=1 Tax=Cichlidogyrus casuarinus TaxID=1844966 RepID=A0ABD2PZQ3_9PLAT